MAFESLGEKLQETFKRLRGKGRVGEKDISAAMREIRLALLEADVNFKVVKDFVGAVSQKAMGADVMESLTPGQQIIKIVRDELSALLGGAQSKILISPKPPTVIMLVGLQGAGKTTTAAKLALWFKKEGRRPMLVACDVYRPAAMRQLEVVGEQAGVFVSADYEEKNPVKIAERAVKNCDTSRFDTVILDTAGRLHIDEELMEELRAIKAAARPTEIIMALDAMTGQDAVNAAAGFNESLGLDGVVLTKLDGDTRGGAALSVRAVTGTPIKFSGVGEKLADLEAFYPDRMASRILGMGDVLTLIDKAKESLDLKQAEELQKKIRGKGMDLNDFLAQLDQVKKMGSIGKIAGMLPGFSAKGLEGAEVDDKQLAKTGAIIKSMTALEREKPEIIGGSRKKRIARGSGTEVYDVNRLLKQFSEMQKLMKQFSSPKAMKNMRFPFGR